MLYRKAAVLLVTLVCCEVSSAIEWTHLPGTMRACVRDEVMFPWKYVTEPNEQVSLIQWQFLTNSVTILQENVRRNGSVSLQYYDVVNYGPDRLVRMNNDDANAGIILNTVKKSDSGQYLTRITGGITDIAELLVYSDDELFPSAEINNKPVKLGSVYNMSDCIRCVIVVSTAHALSADIVITAGSAATNCQSKSTCSMLISGVAVGVTRISLRINYGFCTIRNDFIDVYMDEDRYGQVPDDEHQKSPDGGLTRRWEFILGLTLGIFVILVLVMLGVIIFLVKYIRKREQRSKPLNRHQERIIKTVERWRSIGRNSKRRRPNVTKNHQEIDDDESHGMNQKVEEESNNMEMPDRKDTDMLDTEEANVSEALIPSHNQSEAGEVKTKQSEMEEGAKTKRMDSTETALEDYVII